jgi:hypothetical protein
MASAAHRLRITDLDYVASNDSMIFNDLERIWKEAVVTLFKAILNDKITQDDTS